MHVLIAPSIAYSFFFFYDTATTEIYTLSLHDALPISPTFTVVAFVLKRLPVAAVVVRSAPLTATSPVTVRRSEEHTSELQSRLHLVCRLLLEKKNYTASTTPSCRMYSRSAAIPNASQA